MILPIHNFSIPMTSNLVKLLILLSCAASRSLADNQISWGEYCSCLDEIANVGSVAEDFCFHCCLKKFFRSSPKLTTPIENYKNSSDVCFVSSKDNDPDCKVCRNSFVNLKRSRIWKINQDNLWEWKWPE